MTTIDKGPGPKRAIIFPVLALVLLDACGNTDRPLHAFTPSGGGPDEFSVIPKLPLGTPPTNELPLPTPGGSNRTDSNPNADAIAALGGSASAQVAGGIPAGDAALIAQTGRYGVEPGIRAELAAADEAFRNRRSRSNIFNPLGRDRYFPAYARQALNANAELARLQAAGVAVPDPTFVRPLPPRRTTLPTQPADQPQVAPVEAVEEPQGLLQRTVQGLLPRNRRNCVFTTAGPGNHLRRVCTPIDGEAESATTEQTQPVDQPQAVPAEAAAPAEEQQGLLQRTVQGLLPRNRQNCVFTTEGPGNQLRRVCTPINPEVE